MNSSTQELGTSMLKSSTVWTIFWALLSFSCEVWIPTTGTGTVLVINYQAHPFFNASGVSSHSFISLPTNLPLSRSAAQRALGRWAPLSQPVLKFCQASNTGEKQSRRSEALQPPEHALTCSREEPALLLPLVWSIISAHISFKLVLTFTFTKRIRALPYPHLTPLDSPIFF